MLLLLSSSSSSSSSSPKTQSNMIKKMHLPPVFYLLPCRLIHIECVAICKLFLYPSPPTHPPTHPPPPTPACVTGATLDKSDEMGGKAVGGWVGGRKREAGLSSLSIHLMQSVLFLPPPSHTHFFG